MATRSTYWSPSLVCEMNTSPLSLTLAMMPALWSAIACSSVSPSGTCRKQTVENGTGAQTCHPDPSARTQSANA